MTEKKPMTVKEYIAFLRVELSSGKMTLQDYGKELRHIAPLMSIKDLMVAKNDK